MNHCILRMNCKILACVCVKVFEKRALRRIFWPEGAENCIKRNFKTCTHQILCSEIEENEIDRACGMYREEGKCIHGFDGRNLK